MVKDSKNLIVGLDKPTEGEVVVGGDLALASERLIRHLRRRCSLPSTPRTCR